MKRFLAIALAALPVCIAVWALAQTAEQARTLSSWIPPGALLYLEARDLGSLVADWKGSEEKRLWLESGNYQVFSRSRLFFRLGEMQKEFAAAAGAPPDLPLVESLAGRESALALYDIGEMHFLYISRLDAARAMESALWRAGANFESRASAGKTYFVRREPLRGREAAFAALDGWALIATREEVLAQALALMSGARAPLLRDEPWFQAALGGAPAPGDLRMALNLPALTRTPQFRSYWLQRNVTELRQYAAGLVDLHRGAREFREERRLIRAQSAPAPVAGDLGPLLRLAPPEAGLVRAWPAPSIDAALALLSRKTLAPVLAPVAFRQYAPPVTLDGPVAAYGDDLDTRISDSPPVEAGPELRIEPVRQLLEGAKVESMLLVETSRPGRDKLFIGVDAVAVLAGAADWNPAAARAAFGGAVEGLFTVSGMGLEWQDRGTFFETAGPAHLAMAARGRLLFVATSAEALAPVLARVAAPPAGDILVYHAGYRHSHELANFTQMTRMIDYLTLPEEPQTSDVPRPPMFFSQNLASFGRALGRLDSVTVRVRDDGAAQSQSVVYRLSR